MLDQPDRRTSSRAGSDTTDPLAGRPSYDRQPARRSSWGLQAAVSTALVAVLIVMPMIAVLDDSSSSGPMAPFVIIPVALAVRTGGAVLVVYPVVMIWWLVAVTAWVKRRNANP